jgi:hypothetical protein
MIALFLAALTVSYQPPKPTVGDRITIQFAKPATIDPSEDYEVVSTAGNRVVVRTFTPAPIALSGVSGDVRFRNLKIPVRSVLGPKDNMKPAPLVPPRVPEQPRTAMVAIATASVLALAGWIAAYLLAREKRIVPTIVLAPADRFRADVASSANARQRWASLADATRAYLAARGYGAELTTSQLLGQLHDDLVAEILDRGDYEKFSPWGAPSADFNDLAARAISLIDKYEPREVVEEEAA